MNNILLEVMNVSINELGNVLNEMYSKAPRGEQVAHIHLFGIKYGEIIERQHYRIADIICASGINISYKTELSKGIKLSKYVIPR